MANPYGFARTYQAQSVLTASPGQLVLMLYDGALRFIGQAVVALKSPEGTAGRIEAANKNLQRAQAIIAELQGNLNIEIGGDYARNLDRLYDYHQRRLFEANIKKDPKPAEEVEGLVRQLRDGWAEMLRKDEIVQMDNRRSVAC